MSEPDPNHGLVELATARRILGEVMWSLDKIARYRHHRHIDDKLAEVPPQEFHDLEDWEQVEWEGERLQRKIREYFQEITR